MFKKFTVAKYATALAVPIALMGVIIPKANFLLTSYLMDKDAKKGLLPEKYLRKKVNILTEKLDSYTKKKPQMWSLYQ